MVTTAPRRPTWLYSHWLWLGLFLLVFAPTLSWLGLRWARTFFGSGHGVLVAVVSGYLIWSFLKTEPMEEARSSGWGLPFLVAGLGLAILDTAIHTQILAAIGFVLCIPGLSLLLLGTERTTKITFPLLLLPLMLPIPAGALTQLNLVLRHVTAFATGHAIEWLGIPIMRRATTLFLPGNTVEVADACSGFSTLYASVTLALVLSYLASSPGRRVTLMVSSVLLAVICNIIRVIFLTLIVHFYGVDLLRTALHEISGVITFGVALTGLFLLAERDSVARPSAA